MSNEEVLLSLLCVGVLIVLIYYIYHSVKENKEQEELEKSKKIREEEYKKELIKIRKEDSIKWNDKIQSKYDKNLIKKKYKINRKVKVLIGDYTDSMAPMTNSVLKGMGFDTEVVPSASDIIDRVKDGNKYDLIITNNVYKHGESGQDVLDTLKGLEGFNTPIVILTIDQDARTRYVKEIGFDEYIAKPIDEQKVKTILTKVVKNLKFTEIKKQ